jgi:hypothetical protein
MLTLEIAVLGLLCMPDLRLFETRYQVSHMAGQRLSNQNELGKTDPIFPTLILLHLLASMHYRDTDIR